MTTFDVSVDKPDSAAKATLGGAMFTPAQYAEILKLLSKETAQNLKYQRMIMLSMWQVITYLLLKL